MAGDQGVLDHLILESSLQSFFFDELSKVNAKSTSPISTDTLFYCSLVMDSFGDSTNYFEESDGKVKEKVLGLKLLECGQYPINEQKRILKDIADTSLFLCGFFSDSINRKIVDYSYYQELGQVAYTRLNNMVPSFFEIPAFYKKMSHSFSPVADLMSVVAEKNFKEHAESGEFLIFAGDRKLKVG